MKKSGFKKRGLLAFISTLALTSSVVINSHAAIVINEIDYDQPGTDTAEFIELFNSSDAVISLDNYFIDLINGNNSSSYRTIDLSGFNIDANSYFVVCGDASLVTNCNYSFTATNSWFQNGAPDAVALYENSNLLDSLSYEGVLTPFTEGDTLTSAISDNNADIVSIGRVADGLDSNNNALDFELGCITPGSANIAGLGDCSAADVSAVPVPAAAWLFASGIIGLVGFARRK
jgi:predicted extracellular nuclease